MFFKVAARTVLQLGAELISSDAIAFYELIKNAFDAGSPRVDIDVYVHIKPDAYFSHLERLRKEKENKLTNKKDEELIELCRKEILADVDSSAPRANDVKEEISKASTKDDLIEVLEESNYIQIDDTGCGMSLDDLKEVFLTIGTRSRLKEKEELIKSIIDKSKTSSLRPILGEKGIGRLSAMRLGFRLHIKTSKTGEKRWNVLNIDWHLFSNDSDDMIEDIKISPELGEAKNDPQQSGTLIRISALTSGWSEEKLKYIAAQEFSKLTDPFMPRSLYPISLRYNDDAVQIPRFNKILFEAAHAIVEAEYTVDDKPRLFGSVNYILRKREKSYSLDISDLNSIIDDIPFSALSSVGPFKVKFYWFNRQALRALDGIGDRRTVQMIVGDWAGGLMVFRDGFRVNPYGSPDDDWLDLDRKALASGGYKVNRRQIVGKVDISSLKNIALMDQTNREGLRNCEEKKVLVALLKHILEVQFRAFLNNVDKEIKAQIPITFEDLEDRVGNEEERVRRSLQLLQHKYPQVKKDKEIFSSIEDSVEKIRSLMAQAQNLADSFEKGHAELLNLAGLGLMVEIVAHELNRATQHTLWTLGDADKSELSSDLEGIFKTLEAQLKTLQKRLRILDPMSTAGRQIKEKFDLLDLIVDVLKSHEAQFTRHNIKYSVETKPSGIKSFPVRMVKGMIVQIMENLLSNSVYWLKQKKKLERNFSPKIIIRIDIKEKEIYVTDNGPGIDPGRKEEIFQPFVTTKPPGEGKGLGLYISREIAKYNDSSLEMSEETPIHKNKLNTFIFSLEASKND